MALPDLSFLEALEFLDLFGRNATRIAAQQSIKRPERAETLLPVFVEIWHTEMDIALRCGRT